jgi:uncharacterized protein YndB with AHSA1/START domain
MAAKSDPARESTNPVCEIDPRPGGAILIHMRGPNGDTHPMTCTFEEIVATERIVLTGAALGEDGKPMFEVLTTVTFKESGDKTEMTIDAPVLKILDPAAAFHVGGRDEGWPQSLDRLADEVSGSTRAAG